MLQQGAVSVNFEASSGTYVISLIPSKRSPMARLLDQGTNAGGREEWTRETRQRWEDSPRPDHRHSARRAL